MFKQIAMLAFLAQAVVVNAQYALDVRAPSNAEQAVYANQMRQSDVMQNLVLLVNKHVRITRDVPVIARPCGQPNAFYNPGRREIILCYEVMVDSQMRLQREGMNGGQLIQSVYAETAFLLLHEVGHHLIHEFELPVLGREEDAADKIAAYILLASGGESVLKRATNFFRTRQRGVFSQLLQGEHDYSDSHGLHQQRLANLVCWGMGKQPSLFFDLIGPAKLSQSRLQQCAQEFEAMKRDLSSLLGERLLTESAAGVEAKAGVSTQDRARWAALAAANQCTSCHKPADVSMGPSLVTLAQRYDQGALRAVLQRKIGQGSRGTWGAVPAPAMPNIAEADVGELAKWVSSYQ